jgi:hypothetical protein
MRTPPRTLVRLAAALALLAMALATPAFGAARMWIGFQDDPNLRWNDHRVSAREQTVAEHATMLRTWVFWPYVAPTQPADPTDSDDPAYNFKDLDEFVRQAQIHGQEVLLTIWGTPPWANGGKGPNVLPTNIGAFQQFCYAVAHRYNGHTPGFPYVRFYTIWNEPNLQQFLSPQFSGSKDVGPANYAKVYRAGYAGVKAGSPAAFVGTGETSPRGHDKHVNGIQDSNSPGHFAELLAQQKPAIKFDAYAHHPYVPLGVAPLAPQRYPNVTLYNLGLFETKLQQYFHKKSVPIWITEYAHETRPDEPKGVTYAQQAQYIQIALKAAAKIPEVQMFVWFVLRDDPTSTWQSGTIRANGTLKPGFAAFAKAALPLDARNEIFTVKPKVPVGILRFGVRELAVHMTLTERVGISYQIFDKGKLVSQGAPDSALGFDDWVQFKPNLVPKKGHTYVIKITAGNIHGDFAHRVLTLYTS